MGRSAEVNEVADLLGRYRLVTVMAGQFADGVRLSELASVRDQAQVPATVAGPAGWTRVSRWMM